MKVTVEEYEVLPEDSYDATFVDAIPADSDTGGFWKWTFQVSYDGEEKKLTAASSPRLTRATKAGQWVAAIRHRPVDPGEEFDFDSIVGKPCRLYVSIEDTERGQFNRIDKVLSVKAAGDESVF